VTREEGALLGCVKDYGWWCQTHQRSHDVCVAIAEEWKAFKPLIDAVHEYLDSELADDPTVATGAISPMIAALVAVRARRAEINSPCES
jgi:hypothetical protein